MKKAWVKKIIIVFFVLNIIAINILSVFASVDYNPDDWKPRISNSAETSVYDKAGIIIGRITVAGTIISVVILVMIGIKYMLGSVEEKAEYKKSLMGYVVGAILLFGILNIVNAIYLFAKGL